MTAQNSQLFFSSNLDAELDPSEPEIRIYYEYDEGERQTWDCPGSEPYVDVHEVKVRRGDEWEDIDELLSEKWKRKQEEMIMQWLLETRRRA